MRTRQPHYVVAGALQLLCMIALFWLSVPAAQARDVYTLAIVPQYSPISIHRNWQPLITALNEEAGIEIRLRVYNSFNRFIGALERGQVDFAYLAPYHLVMAKRTQHYMPLLRDGKRELVGIVVVREDSPYKTVHDLDGKIIDFPSPSAFAASLYLRAYLREKLNIKYLPRYVGNHDNVYRHVAFGMADAGGGVNNTLSQQPAGLQEKLRILYEVPGVASHPLAAHERVPREVRENIITILMRWQNDPAHRHLLAAVQLDNPVLADYQRDYQQLEHMDLDKYLSEPGR